MFKLKYKLIMYAASLLIVLSLFGVTYYKGYDAAKTKYQHAAIVAELKGIQEHERIKKEIMQLDRPDLDHALSYWMRDN